MSIVKPAGFWKRIAAAYVNLLVILLFAAYVIPSFSPKEPLIIILGIIIFNDVILQGFTGRNIGKFLLGLKAINVSKINLEKITNETYNEIKSIGLFKAIFRSIISIFSFLALGLGVFVIAFNKDKKALHDLLTSSNIISDPKTIIPGFIRNTITFVMALIFIVSLFTLPATVLSSGYIAYSTLNQSRKITTVSSKTFDKNPATTLSIKASESTVNALASFNDKAAIESAFQIDTESSENLISKAVLDGLKASFWDYMVMPEQSDDSWSLKQKIIIPELILSDSNKKDLIIKDLIFTVDSEKNVLAKDFLKLFDSTLNTKEKLLKLKLHPEEKAIYTKFKNPEAEETRESRDYELYVLNTIRNKWREALAKMPYELLEDVTKSKKRFSNEVEIGVETKRGNITRVKFNNPSKNERFNEYTQEFIKGLDRFRNIPKSLKKEEAFSLNFKLETINEAL